jgi:hypothetical protein
MSTLEIVFYGLVAFIPTDLGGGKHGMTVVLPDAVSTQAANGCTIAQHHAWVAFEHQTCSVGAGGDPTDCDWQVGLLFDKGQAASGSWILDKEDLVINFPAGEIKGPTTLGNGVNLPNGGSAKDLKWVAQMRSVTPEQTFSTKPACTEVQPVSGGCDILGRFAVPEGSLQTCHLAQKPQVPLKGDIYAYDFHSLKDGSVSKGQPQALADAVGMTIQFNGKLDLSTVPFGGNTPSHHAKLTVGAGETLRLYVMNVPTIAEEDIAMNCSGDNVSDHFELYYKLLDGTNLKKFVPVRRAESVTGAYQPPACGSYFVNLANKTVAEMRDSLMNSKEGWRLDTHSPRVPPACPPAILP